MKKRKGILCLLFLFLMSAGCGQGKQEQVTIIELQESALETDALVQVTRGDIALVTDVDAWVGPKMVQLAFAEEGSFGEFYARLGDTVKKGDVLAVPYVDNLDERLEAKQKELNSMQENYAYRKATLENDLELAKVELERLLAQIDQMEYMAPGYTEKCIRAVEFDEQRKRLEIVNRQLQETYDLELPHCRGELEKLQKKKAGNRILAPFDGVVVATKDAEYRERIDTGQYYIALADPTVTYVRCEGQSVGALQKMEKIQFWKDGVTYDVEFVQRDAKFYQEMRGRSGDNFTEFLVKEGAENLEDGDYGLIQMTSRHKEDVLLLPENAVGNIGGNTYVYLDEDGKKKQVMVETGYRDGLMVEIVSGLAEGDMVYVQQ